MPNKLEEFFVTYRYVGQVTVRVMAAREEDAAACPDALERADEAIQCNLSVVDLSVKRAAKK